MRGTGGTSTRNVRLADATNGKCSDDGSHNASAFTSCTVSDCQALSDAYLILLRCGIACCCTSSPSEGTLKSHPANSSHNRPEAAFPDTVSYPAGPYALGCCVPPLHILPESPLLLVSSPSALNDRAGCSLPDNLTPHLVATHVCLQCDGSLAPLEEGDTLPVSFPAGLDGCSCSVLCLEVLPHSFASSVGSVPALHFQASGLDLQEVDPAQAAPHGSLNADDGLALVAVLFLLAVAPPGSLQDGGLCMPALLWDNSQAT